MHVPPSRHVLLSESIPFKTLCKGRLPAKLWCPWTFRGAFVKSKKTAAEAGPSYMDVLVDVLLSLLARPSAAVRDAVDQVRSGHLRKSVLINLNFAQRKLPWQVDTLPIAL